MISENFCYSPRRRIIENAINYTTKPVNSDQDAYKISR